MRTTTLAAALGRALPLRRVAVLARLEGVREDEVARLKASELTPGTLALCAVREVHSSRAILSLPDGHLGLLERLELSDELHAEIAGGGEAAHPPDLRKLLAVGELLLEPTQLYARPIRSVLRHYRVKQVVHGIAHITGGGLEENLARIVPPAIQIQIERGSWEIPPVFDWLQKLGSIEQAEMDRVFNMGVGMV